MHKLKSPLLELRFTVLPRIKEITSKYYFMKKQNQFKKSIFKLCCKTVPLLRYRGLVCCNWACIF